MSEGEKKTEAVKKKRSSKKDAGKSSAKAKEPEQSSQELTRDQLESLREKLQRKYH